MTAHETAAHADGGGSGNLFRLSTRGLETSERFAHWERRNAEVLFPFSARSLDTRPFDAAETALKLPSITFAHVIARPHIIERNQQHIDGGGAEGAMLFFSLVGGAFFHHRGGNHSQRPGTLLVCDTSRPFLRGFARELQEYAVTVRRDVYEAATGAPVPAEPTVMSFAASAQGNAHSIALAALVQESLSTPGLAATIDIEHRFLETMTAMLAPRGEGSPTARTHAALAFIRRRLKDPSLSVVSVAQGIGVSERSLIRAFAETGEGVARTILEMRLAAAHRILAAPGPPQVREVAKDCGFVSATHFSRVFRERYGVTPSDVRAEGSGLSGE